MLVWDEGDEIAATFFQHSAFMDFKVLARLLSIPDEQLTLQFEDGCQQTDSLKLVLKLQVILNLTSHDFWGLNQARDSLQTGC
jgi:hypothetical protein